jgi:putative two-component system response regulator
MDTYEESIPLRAIMAHVARSDARVLVIDDDEAMVAFLESLLREVGLELTTTSDPLEALGCYQAFQPDLVILDLHMPQMNGFEVMQQLFAEIPDTQYLPILVITADDQPETKWRALSAGARDFINKPFENIDLLVRIRNLLEARLIHSQLHTKNQLLQARVRERAHLLADAQGDAIERLAQVVEFHDDATGDHTRRVGEISGRIAEALDLGYDEVDLIRRAAPLHDVGKIGIPDLILLRPERLRAEEFELVKLHTSIGARIFAGGRSAFMEMAEQIAFCHHERWDGEGYPRGLKEEETPLAARIVAVADVYDSLCHDRPYRQAWPEERVLEEIDRGAGTQFDRQVSDAFLRIHTEIGTGE